MFLEEFSLDCVDAFPCSGPLVPRTPALPDPARTPGFDATLFLGSDLFRAASLKRGRLQRRGLLNVVGEGPSAVFDGEELDQFDQDVFLGCVMRALRGESPVGGAMRDFLTSLGCRITRRGLARLEASLLRLAKARIQVDDERFGFCVQMLQTVLIDREKGVFRAQASPEAVSAFRSVKGLIRLERLRRGMRLRPLTKWLAGFVLSLGGDRGIFELPELRVLCGRTATDAKVFASKAAEALHALADMGYVDAVIRHGEDEKRVAIMTGRGVGGAGSGLRQPPFPRVIAWSDPV